MTESLAIYSQLINEKTEDILNLLFNIYLPSHKLNESILVNLLKEHNLLELSVSTNDNVIYVDMVNILKKRGYFIKNKKGLIQKTKKVPK